jgi:SAM-dependent methyltransferase
MEQEVVHVPEKPIAFDAYETLADRYAARISTKPHNAYYERPAMLALLPDDLTGWRVLDAGCGTGWGTVMLLDRGAIVSGVEISPAMLRHGQERTGGRADLRLHDLRLPMPFYDDGTFDLVYSSMVVHYIEDWDALFAEFERILHPGGLFLFSSGHPFYDYQYFDDADYFHTELRSSTWRGFGGEPISMPFYRRPLSATTESLFRAGFVVERLIEPLPTEEFRQADPKDYDKLRRFPAFLCIRARKG